jgi:hypothetical protein
MNIFYLDHDVTKCAEMHNDKHCVKMILEYAQLLSTAHRYIDGTQSVRLSKTGRKQTAYDLPDERELILYSATHINHPSAVWVRESAFNYLWLHELLDALCKEYTYRYGKVHKIEASGLLLALRELPNNIDRSYMFTQPTPAMPDDVKVQKDSIASYRNYYIKNKTHLAKWKNRPIPSWYVEGTLFNANL